MVMVVIMVVVTMVMVVFAAAGPVTTIAVVMRVVVSAVVAPILRVRRIAITGTSGTQQQQGSNNGSDKEAFHFPLHSPEPEGNFIVLWREIQTYWG